MKRIMIFASGGGSNFIAIHKNILKGEISNANIEGLVSNNPKCGAVSYAINNNIRTYIINSFRYKTDENISDRLIEILEEKNIDLLVLAGYMKLIPYQIVDRYNNKIINIHPSYLPEYGGKGYYGSKVHKAVLKDKKDFTGVTVHYVNNKYDEGEIIFQKKIEVKNDDNLESLSKRVLDYEHIIYSKVINNICNDYQKEKND